MLFAKFSAYPFEVETQEYVAVLFAVLSLISYAYIILPFTEVEVLRWSMRIYLRINE